LGEVVIEVPDHWKVVVELSPVLGEIKEKRPLHTEQNEEKILTIKGYCLLGEVKIKS